MAGKVKAPNRRATGNEPASSEHGANAEGQRRRRPSNPGHMLVARVSDYIELEELIERVDGELQSPHGATALSLYLLLKAHLDWQGRMEGSPIVIRGRVLPRVKNTSEHHIKVYLREMANLKLIAWYRVGRQECIADLRWDEEQVNLPAECRRQPSHYPAPDDPRAVALNRSPAGTQQGLFAEPAGSVPAARQHDAGLIGSDRIGSEGIQRTHTPGAREGVKAPPVESLPPAPASPALAAFSAIVARKDRGGLMPDRVLVEALAELAQTEARALRVEAVPYAEQACDAYDLYRVSCKPSMRPNWSEEGLRKHWSRLTRILAGTDPRPEPWKPEAQRASGGYGGARTVGPARAMSMAGMSAGEE